jgi:tetratricopeptide (TPR) repeat protein
LWRIRRLLAIDDLLADSNFIQFNPARNIWLDTVEFERLVSNALPQAISEKSIITDLQSAVGLYRGDLLEGFYDDWCIEERYRLEIFYLDALKRLIAHFDACRDAMATLSYTQKYLARDQLEENIHLVAIHAFASLGNRVGAQRQWQFYCESRQRELGQPPSPEMLRQAERILGIWAINPLPIAEQKNGPAHHKHDLFDHPPFIGRERELTALLERWNRAVQGSSSLVLIAGEAGVGKTRLTEELSAMIQWRGGLVAYGHNYEAEHTIPYQPFAEIVRTLLAIEKTHSALVLPGWVRKELSWLIPELENGHTGESEERGVRLLHSVLELIRNVALRAPLLIVLEDLQWAADSSLGGLDYLIRHIAKAPILILGTYRPEEVNDAHSLTAMASQLARDGLALHVAIETLSPEGVAKLIRQMGGDSPESAGGLYAHTQGNAFFLVETLRELASISHVRLGQGGQEQLPVPGTVRALIHARLARLNQFARKFIAYAAVAGEAFDFDVVRSAAKVTEEVALEAIDELLVRGFLREESGVSGHDYKFRHSLIYRIVYESIHHHHRRLLHRLIGEALENIYREGQGELLGQLAYHFDRGGVGNKTLVFAEQAARRAWSLGAANEAKQYYDLALHWLKKVGEGKFGEQQYRERQFDLLLGREQALDILAHREEQIADQRMLMTLAESLDDNIRRIQVHLRRFWLHYPLRMEEARREAESTLALSELEGNSALRVQALYVSALAYARLGNPARGLEYAEMALAQARELGDRWLEGWSLLQLGFIYKQMDDPEHAQATLETSLALNRTLGNRFAIGRTLVHLGDIHQARGRLTDAEQYYREALTLAHETGYRWVEEDVHARLAHD